jgi:hypothetical protein
MKETIVTAGAFLGSSKSLLSMAKSDSAIESSIVDLRRLLGLL